MGMFKSRGLNKQVKNSRHYDKGAPVGLCIMYVHKSGRKHGLATQFSHRDIGMWAQAFCAVIMSLLPKRVLMGNRKCGQENKKLLFELFMLLEKWCNR